jgi:DNA primase large subunit
VGVKDQEVLRGVKEDKEKMKFHLACNRFVSLSPFYPLSTKYTIPTITPQFSTSLSSILGCRIWIFEDFNADEKNRVFEYAHKQEIKKVKDEGTWTANQLETIVHPNEYFKRSYLLKNMGRVPKVEEGVKSGEDVKMEG